MIFIILLEALFILGVLGYGNTAHYEKEEVEIKSIITAVISAYSSSPEQTDDTPFHTANGERVAPGTIACPGALEFGTSVMIKGRQYTCNDRMNKRYRHGNYFDIWTPTRGEAVAFGRQTLPVVILD